jgi:hypothetical protein
MRSGRAYERQPLELHTVETDGGAWPTATAADAKSSGSLAYSTESGRHSGETLTDAAKAWTTPLAAEGDKAPKFHGHRGQKSLTTQSREFALYPTPTAQSYGTNQGGAAGRTGKVRPSLDQLSRSFPLLETTGEDGDGCSSDGHGSPPPSGPDYEWVMMFMEEMRVGNAMLNPAFVSWLLGAPWWWLQPEPISCGAQETASLCSRLRRRLLALLDGR